MMDTHIGWGEKYHIYREEEEEKLYIYGKL
jgi:hypothetical protein